ncbi:MAG: AAA family ATPase [Campylobacterota bacterium]|nr:AAA family ATPase [Campylobacterota bacterium]
MELQKLPIGIQTFKDIIEENYIYIDKTDIAYELIESYKYVFLSRPRRFGKSLFLDTLKNIFEGNKEYFGDLSIESKWNWDIKYPVIKISFGVDLRSLEKIEASLRSSLEDNQKRLGVECKTNKFVSICFKEFIQAVYEKYNQKVVVLIDEYDKAILDNLDQMDVAKEAREITKGFYTVLKDADPYLKFVFLTGVSKFSKASIFSGLNMIEDISLTPKFGNICGYAQNDIETSFSPYLEGQDYTKIKRWYNGYNFLKDPLYNPFDLLKFIKNDFAFKNYWFTTSTPSYLIKLIEKNKYYLPRLSNLTIGEQILDSFDIDNIDLEVILYQSGYLTIDNVIEKRRGGFEYKLKLPNEEVKTSLSDYLIDYITSQRTEKYKYQDDLYDAICQNDIEFFKTSLSSMFASLPYNNFTKNSIQTYEGFYASVIYVYLQSLGFNIIGEDVTNKGRIDLTINMNDTIYILEFKVDGQKGEALKQIKEMNYQKKYVSLDKHIYLIGIEFDSDEKNISNFEWEVLK